MTGTDSEPQEYDWGLAPAHLQTRRQLRAAGLGPNRQGVAALMVGKSKGRRLIAHLFDVRKAAPKRVPTPAQLDAIRKATVEHQARAAERHGITRAELAESADPAPGWEHTPTQKEGITVSDSTLDVHLHASELERAVELAQQGAAYDVWRGEGANIPAGVPVTAAVIETQETLDAHLLRYRDELSQDHYWKQRYAALDRWTAERERVVPQGHNQRIAYLLATVAANQARVDDAALAQAIDNARAEGPEAVEALQARCAADQVAAEARMRSIPWHNPTATVRVFSDALLWSGNSELAQQALGELIGRYAAQWGVVVDPETFSVRVDPAFDADTAWDQVAAGRQWQRASAVLGIVAAMPLRAAAKGVAAEALSTWRGSIDPADPVDYLHTTAERRDGLTAALAPLSDHDRAHVEFVVDYLTGYTGNVDLLASPVVVDPGEEARGRIPRLLAAYQANPNASKFVGEEIAVMTAADQQRVREVGRQIARGEHVDVQVWPGYVDRYEVREMVTDYTADAEQLSAAADHLATGALSGEERDRLGVNYGGEDRVLCDDVHKRITRMAALNDQVRATISSGKGLVSMERAKVSETLADIDAGCIRSHRQLPELLFADERSKADTDAVRTSRTASTLSTTTREAITERIEAAGVTVDHRHERLRFAVTSISDSIYTVACGSRTGDLPAQRQSYMDQRRNLTEALGKQGLGAERQTEIRQLVDGRARQAGEIGRAAAERTDQWKAKTESIVGARNDQLAQRRAANAGRSTGSGRSCTTRPDPSSAQEHPRARTTTHRMNSPEIGR